MTGQFILRIKASETYRLLRAGGVLRAAAHLWSLGVKNWRALMFIDVEGYIAEADLQRFSPQTGLSQKIKDLGIIFHILGRGEALPAFSYGITQEEIERRMDQGHRCYVIKEAGAVVSSCWVGVGKVSYGGASVYLYSNHPIFLLEPGQAWSYDIITEPAHRRKGLSTILKHEVMTDLKNLGISRLTATVGIDNVANIKSLLRAGFTLKERVRYRRFLFFRYRKRKKPGDEEISQIAKTRRL